MKFEDDYFEFSDGSCYDFRSDSSYNSIDAMYNGRINDSYSDLCDAFEGSSLDLGRPAVNLTDIEMHVYKTHYINHTWKNNTDKNCILTIEKKIYGDKAKKIIFEGQPVEGGRKINFWLYWKKVRK